MIRCIEGGVSVCMNISVLLKKMSVFDLSSTPSQIFGCIQNFTKTDLSFQQSIIDRRVRVLVLFVLLYIPLYTRKTRENRRNRKLISTPSFNV